MTINQLRDFPSPFRLFVLTLLCFNLSACFEPTFEGHSSIQNGIVQAYLIEDLEGVGRISSTTVGDQVEADEDGFFRLVLPQYTNTDLIAVKVTATEQSTYSCMLIENCQPEPIPTSFSLWGALPELRLGEKLRFKVGILSHLAMAQAQAGSVSLTRQAIDDAYSNIENSFSLSHESVFNSHAALRSLMQSSSSLEGLEGSLKAMLIESAFIVMSKSAELDGIKEIVELTEFSFGGQGGSGNTRLGGSRIEIANLFALAKEQAEFLVDKEESFDRRAVLLNAVNQLNLNLSAGGNMGSYFEPLEILLQPMPKMIHRSQSADFRVTTRGGGLITYQWHKDGAVIEGANTPVLSIDLATEADEGSYYVVVTNSSGSLISHQATLTVVNEEVSSPLESALNPEPDIPVVVDASSPDIGLTDDDFEQSAEPEEQNQAGDMPDETGAESVVQADENTNNAETKDGEINTIPGGENSTEPESEIRRTVALIWSVPVSKTSGEVLSLLEIKGYSLIYGKEPDALNTRIVIPGAFGLRYNVNGLLPESYYFAVATIDVNDVQGPYSETIHLDLR